jgi:hypothetical protein
MNKETLRMQMLAGIITEGQYKSKLNEYENLEENLWDKIKNAPKAFIAKIRGGAPGILSAALVDSGWAIGKTYYFVEKDGKDSEYYIYSVKIKNLNYNTGESEVEIKKSKDGDVFELDSYKSLENSLRFGEDFSKLQNMTSEEQKEWYDKMVKDLKDPIYGLENATLEKAKEELKDKRRKESTRTNTPFPSDKNYSVYSGEGRPPLQDDPYA